MSSGVIRRLNQGSGGVMDAARCHGCGHPARIHNRVGCVSGPCECVVTRAELMPDAPRLEVPVGVVSTPAAPPSAPAPPSVAAAPAPAVAPAAPAGPVGAPPAPVELPPWLPGAGVPRVKPTPAPIVEVTTPDEDVVRRVDEIIAAGKLAARKRPRRTDARPAASPALVSAAVVGERDAVGEVAATDLEGPVAATVTPEPLDLEPFLSAAVYSYAAWYCDRCHQRRHDPGACPDCRRTLQPVYVAIIPRSAP